MIVFYNIGIVLYKALFFQGIDKVSGNLIGS